MSTFPAEQPQDPAISPWLVRLPLLFVSGGVLLMLILSALVGVYQIAFSQRILPGVSSYGINLGGMTRDEASAALDKRFTYAKDAVFTFRENADHFWQLSAGDLGVTFDSSATVADAFAAGHSGTLIDKLVDQALIWLNGRSIAPIIRYDQNKAVAQLETIAQTIDSAPQDATLTINGTEIQATAGQSGHTLDITATLAKLDDGILN